MVDAATVRAAIVDRLGKVIDPETGLDVIRMRLIEDLAVSEEGKVAYKFRPSSPLCPLALPLSLDIQHAVAEVEGVTGQDMEVVGLLLAEDLMAWLKEMGDDLWEQDQKNSTR